MNILVVVVVATMLVVCYSVHLCDCVLFSCREITRRCRNSYINTGKTLKCVPRRLSGWCGVFGQGSDVVVCFSQDYERSEKDCSSVDVLAGHSILES